MQTIAIGSTDNRDRRAHQCRLDGCDSPARYDLYMHIRYGHNLIAIETLKCTIRVCEGHKKQANDFILSDFNKHRVSSALAKIGRLGIDWPNAMIEFVPCGEASWGVKNMIQLPTGRA